MLMQIVIQFDFVLLGQLYSEVILRSNLEAKRTVISLEIDTKGKIASHSLMRLCQHK